MYIEIFSMATSDLFSNIFQDVYNCWLHSLKERGSDLSMLQLNGQVPMWGEINEILVYYIFKSLSPGCLPLSFFFLALVCIIMFTKQFSQLIACNNVVLLFPSAFGLDFHNKLLWYAEGRVKAPTSWGGRGEKSIFKRYKVEHCLWNIFTVCVR